MRKLLMTTVPVLTASAAVPSTASADWLFTPFVGINWGGAANFGDVGDFDDEFEKRGDFGATLAWMGAGAVGFEVDFGWSPNFFENTTGSGNFEFGDSNVTTLMGNLVVGAPIGGQSGPGSVPTRPAVSASSRAASATPVISSTSTAPTGASTWERV